jgi:hypothetical protein
MEKKRREEKRREEKRREEKRREEKRKMSVGLPPKQVSFSISILEWVPKNKKKKDRNK